MKLLKNGTQSNKHKLLLIVTLGSFAIVIMIFLASSPKSNQDELSKLISSSKDKIILQDPNSAIDAEDLWLEDAETRLDKYEDFAKNYSVDKASLESRIQTIEKKHEEVIASQSKIISNHKKKISQLEEKLKGFKKKARNPDGFKVKSNESNSNYNSNYRPYSNDGLNYGNSGVSNQDVLTSNIAEFNLSLDGKDDKSKKAKFHKVSKYVPAGAYAQAVIISGVDASVGISSQSDPRPVLLRIKGKAFSSIYDGNVAKANLTGCIVTGAASADLSSEKVYIKLVNMTCSKSKDLIFETAIKGYVAGQGKSGVRGDVISREGDIIAKSFIAGIIGGFGSGLSQKVAPPLSFSNGLTTQQALSSKDVLNRGLGQGISSSSERIANYMINRAEQYQPVVSIPSGIDVEIVFVEGFYLDGRRKRKASTNSNTYINKFEGGR